jgi:hypothetical protein
MKSIAFLAAVFVLCNNLSSTAQNEPFLPGIRVDTQKNTTGSGIMSPVKYLEAPFFGLNTKNIGDGNFMADINVLETGWKRTHARIYRYPGGTFGNSFDWHSGTTIIDGRPPQVSPPVRPADVAENLPENTDILWMANIRIPTPATGYDWRTMTREELLSQEVLDAKIQDILEGLQSFKNAGREVKYLELGNEFYFSKDEGPGEIHGAGGDNPASDFQGDHFPYDKNPQDYINQMAQLAKSVKELFPDIKIAVIKQKMEAGNQANWNSVIDDAFRNDTDLQNYVDAVIYHWYQNEQWYPQQSGWLPAVTDLRSVRNALGLAFDYFTFKENHDLKNIPEGKEVWVTEGDIKDPSTGGTWSEAIREALVNVHYLLMPGVTLYTPQIFQPKYIEFDDLSLTLKGQGIDMVYAAATVMRSIEKMQLDDNSFYSDYGGPYPDLSGVKLSDGTRERILLINASEHSYHHIDLSEMVAEESFSRLTRSSTAPWTDQFQQQLSNNPDLSDFIIPPFSISLLAEASLINKLIDPAVFVVNPQAEFPKRRVGLYDFGEVEPGKTATAVLAIRNAGTNTVFLDNESIKLAGGLPFDLDPAMEQVIEPGEQVSFTIRFSPESTGYFADILVIEPDDHTRYEVRIGGTACYFCNADFEKGHEVGWRMQATGDVAVEYDQATVWNTAEGEVSGRVHVIYGVNGTFDDVGLSTPLIWLEQPVDKLKVRIQAKSEPGEAEIQLSVIYFNASSLETGRHFSEPIPLSDTYQHIEFTGAHIPEGSVQYQVVLGCGNQTGNYYFDNLEINPLFETHAPEPRISQDIVVRTLDRNLVIESQRPTAFSEIAVFSLGGEQLLTGSALQPATRQWVNLSADWPPGIYIVYLRENRQPSGFSRKIILW